MQKEPFLTNIAQGDVPLSFVTGLAYPVSAFLATSTLAASVGSALPKSSFAKPSHDDDDDDDGVILISLKKY
ncbi:hypothetical protein WISP_41083 [Willisornis vidua]|uniref:Uncharacterized protein n=1 Tax=Willisornis vidua TaxID=1566151 RepID=A0ABQ9DGX4_9PASS|nr:hypothetical protein WISP_41083 [Willisornis vidua]